MYLRILTKRSIIRRTMKLTKYQHACFTVAIDGQVLVVDPGDLTTDLDAVDGIVGVVITHQHADHCDPRLLDDLVSEGVKLYAHQSVIDEFDLSSAEAVAVDDIVEIGPFRLEFYGGDHATIHPNVPGIANLGVLINDTVYYPGDSFAPPDVDVEALMLPVAAPWMKIAEAIDYVNQVRPSLAIPTHDAILSPDGQAIVDRVVSSNLATGIDYRRLTAELEIVS